jgi:hypothetical protein
MGASSTGGASDKLRSTFKCPKFLGDARHWKQWNKGFVRYLAIQQLDHIIEVEFKTMTMTVALNADNKFVYYLLEDAVSGSAVATKYVHRAPIWDGHAAYNSLFDGYSFSGPATATLLLSELRNFRFKVDETGTELVLRLQELFEDLEAVPGQSAVVFSDTQKINYLLSAVKHEKTLQSVYVQIQTDQLRGRITFEQSCDDLRYRCEANRADELLNTQVKGSVKGLMAREEAPYCQIHDHAAAGPKPTPVALITTAGKRQNRPKKESACLAKGCESVVPAHIRLCRMHYHECIAGKQPSLPLRTGGHAHYDASTNKIVYPASSAPLPSAPATPASALKKTVKAQVAFTHSGSDDSN